MTRRTTQLAAAATIAALALISAPSARALSVNTAGIRRVFTNIEKAIRGKKLALFKKQWHPEGFAKNIVGGSGMPGRAVYSQGTRKGWYLKPDMNKLFSLPGRRAGPWVIPCEVYSWKRKRAVDKVWALVVYARKLKRWVILGAGEKRKQVNALGLRFVAKKPLKP